MYPIVKENDNMTTSIINNNIGVDSIMSLDFKSAIQWFQESLKCSRSELLAREDAENDDKSTPHRGPQSPSESNSIPFQIECDCSSQIGRTDETSSSLKAYLQPFRMLQSSAFPSSKQTPGQREARCNLSIGVTILNAAIAYHLLFLTEDASSETEQETRKSKARSLYTKAAQIIGNLNFQHPDAKHFEVICDLCLIVSLNNSLVLMDEVTGQCTQQLVEEIVRCSAKDYGTNAIAEALSQWQEECLTNVLLMKMLKPMSAAAA